LERRIVNPLTRQDAFGCVPANEVSGASPVLLCAGHPSADAEGQHRIAFLAPATGRR
jgi:hypothetical protein